MSVRRLGVETRTMRTRRRDGGFWEPCGLRLCRWLEFWYFCGPWFVFEIVVFLGGGIDGERVEAWDVGESEEGGVSLRVEIAVEIAAHE